MTPMILTLLLCAGGAPDVRLHVVTEDPTLRIVDATTDAVVCYGTCDEALPAGRPYRTLDRVSLKTYAFTLDGTAPEGVLDRVRRPQLTKVGAIVLGYGAASVAAGLLTALVGWYGHGNGLNPQAWPRTVMDVGATMAGVGLPIALAGATLLFFGLRPAYEVQYATGPGA